MADDKKHAPHDDLENSGATENVGESSSSVKTSTSEHDPYQDNQSTGTKWLDKFLNGIEYLGNKLPEPFTIFLGLFLLTGILSTIFAWQNITFQVPGSDEVQEIHGLFTGEGMTWLTTTMGENYLGFPPLVTVLPILLGVGIA
ncbi:AbgT family transporter, partial [Corynebacterium stationis]